MTTPCPHDDTTLPVTFQLPASTATLLTGLLEAERRRAGDCIACGDDAEPVAACGCVSWAHDAGSGMVWCQHHRNQALVCGECGQPRSRAVRLPDAFAYDSLADHASTGCPPDSDATGRAW